MGLGPHFRANLRGTRVDRAKKTLSLYVPATRSLQGQGVIKVVHIITGLSTGGAETMLGKLLSASDRTEFTSEVISLTDIGPVGARIQAEGFPVRSLGMTRGFPNPFGMLKLAAWLREIQPDLVQTWMYHSDLLGGLSAVAAGRPPVVWGIRQSNLDRAASKSSTIATAYACARLSAWLPDRILCCSEASARVHKDLGYRSEKMVVIPNGFDTEHFRPSDENRQEVRRELSLPDDAILIGLVARFDPQKDHANFLEAANLLLSEFLDVNFLLCGDGVGIENACLRERIESSPAPDQFHLLGRRSDTPRLTSALDIATSSSSFGEGFPNVIGEAMACGVPCVVTDVGDSALIVGAAGKVVPPKDPGALALAWGELIGLSSGGRTELGLAGRARVEENFGLQSIARRYEDLYRSVARRPPAAEKT